jgi:hypothetical protein
VPPTRGSRRPENKLQGTRRLLASDGQGARRELQKHIEDLRVTPAPDIGQRVIRITGRGKMDGLLEGEEGPPATLFGQERDGPPRVLCVLADRAPYQNPNGAGKGSQVRLVLPGATGHPASARRG